MRSCSEFTVEVVSYAHVVNILIISTYFLAAVYDKHMYSSTSFYNIVA